MLKSLFPAKKTFKPKKKIPSGSRLQALHNYSKATQKRTLGNGLDLRQCVALPPGEDKNEWLAVNVWDFYNQINLLYGSISSFCLEETCPVMAAGPHFEYYWQDEVTKKTTKCSAPQYIDSLMEWTQRQISDESIFPTKIGAPFPRDFEQRVSVIFKRLFRVYAHIYHSHLTQIVEIGAEPHLNTCFKHFTLFILEFNLVDKKELAVLSDLINSLGLSSSHAGPAATS